MLLSDAINNIHVDSIKGTNKHFSPELFLASLVIDVVIFVHIFFMSMMMMMVQAFQAHTRRIFNVSESFNKVVTSYYNKD